MNNDKIKFLTETIIEKLPEIETNDLFYGKMGICIYLFLLSRYTKDEKYQEKAEELLDEICENLSFFDEILFDIGLSGISWGIVYLAQQKYIDANIDFVLSEIDNVIFKRISSKTIDDLEKMHVSLLGILIYLIYRIKDRIHHITEANQLKKDLIIFTLNTVDTLNNKDNYSKVLSEPFFPNLSRYYLPVYIYVLAELYKLGFYNIKIDRIIDSLSPFVLKTIPLSHCNRIYLLSAIYHLQSVKKTPEWERHISLLENSIDIEYMLQNEFPDRALTMDIGISGLLFVLHTFAKTGKFAFTDTLCEKIENKINSSTYFKDTNCQLGLAGGISGIALALLLNEMNKNA